MILVNNILRNIYLWSNFLQMFWNSSDKDFSRSNYNYFSFFLKGNKIESRFFDTDGQNKHAQKILMLEAKFFSERINHTKVVCFSSSWFSRKLNDSNIIVICRFLKVNLYESNIKVRLDDFLWYVISKWDLQAYMILRQNKEK